VIEPSAGIGGGTWRNEGSVRTRVEPDARRRSPFCRTRMDIVEKAESGKREAEKLGGLTPLRSPMR
jgi:hypothetical protein